MNSEVNTPSQNDSLQQLTHDLARVLTRFNRVCLRRSHLVGKLKRSEFHLLLALFSLEQPGTLGVKASEISSHLAITPAAVTHLLNSIEKQGYIERVTDLNDRRIVLIRPTPEGEKVLLAARSRALEELSSLVDYLGAQDSRELIRLLSTMIMFYQPPQERTLLQDTSDFC